MKRALLVCAAFCILSAFALAQTPSPTLTSTGHSTMPTAYDRWINEDVHWIITPSEEAQYRALKTNADRSRFVEDFWLQRDPTPGTPENEFKEEHYRRLAYSNAHFAEGKPGWSTDRGHVYVKFGPPDGIVVLPGREHPMLLWRYKTRQHHDFRFVDECDCGKYKLESDPLR